MDILDILTKLGPLGVLIGVLALVILQQNNNQKTENEFKTNLLSLLNNTDKQRDRLQGLVEDMQEKFAPGIQMSMATLSSQIKLQSDNDKLVTDKLTTIEEHLIQPDKVKARMSPVAVDITQATDVIARRESMIVQTALSDIAGKLQTVVDGFSKADDLQNWPDLHNRIEALRTAVIAIQNDVKDGRAKIIEAVRAIPADTSRILLPTMNTAIDRDPTPTNGVSVIAAPANPTLAEQINKTNRSLTDSASGE